MASDLLRGDDETKVTDLAFNRAEPAITFGVEIDLARVRRDACISQMHFEGDELCSRSACAGVEFPGQDACATGGVDS